MFNCLKSNEMKKNLILWLIMACFAMTLAGCSKEEAAPQTDSDVPEVILDFTVGERDGFGPDTKAVKTDWAEGDQILVLYKLEDGGWMFGDSPTYSVLTYDGTAWSQKNTGMSIAFLSGGYRGDYYAIHYRGTVGIGTVQDNEVELTGYGGGEFMCCSGSFETKSPLPTGQVLLGLSLSDINLTLDPHLYQVSVTGAETYRDLRLWLSIEYVNVMRPKEYTQLPHYACQSGMLYFDKANSCIGIRQPDNYNAIPVFNSHDASFCFYIAEGSDPGPIKTDKYRFTFTLSATQYTYEKERSGSSADGYLTAGYAYRLPLLQNGWSQK